MSPHGKYVASQLAHWNHVASKLSFTSPLSCTSEEASHLSQQVLTLELPFLTSNSLHSSQSLAINEVPIHSPQLLVLAAQLAMYWLLDSCAIHCIWSIMLHVNRDKR